MSCILKYFRIVINGVKPFEAEKHTNHYLLKHKRCDADHTPAMRRKPTQPPLVLDDEDEPMSQDYDYDYEDNDIYMDYDLEEEDEEPEFIGRSSIM